MLFPVHLLATDCIVTTNMIIMPYKVVYLDSKLVTAIAQHFYMYSTVYVWENCNSFSGKWNFSREHLLPSWTRINSDFHKGKLQTIDFSS